MSRLGVLGVAALFAAVACRSGSTPPPADARLDPGKEPGEYSATVITTTQNGSKTSTSTTRTARSGDMRRYEWTENSARRVLIWRPDLAKSFLLDPDQKLYVELDDSAPTPGAGNTAEEIDRQLGDTPSPERVVTKQLEDATIDGSRCSVFETVVNFPSGDSELIRTFRIKDSDFTIRSEIEHGGSRSVVERREMKTSVAPEEFNVPADFRKVANLRRN